MKILYVTWSGGVDYLADTIMIGLVNNGHEVLDTNYCRHLGPLTDEERGLYYGRAFTVGNTLLAEREFIDRSNIEEKIRSKYFDIVIYPSPYRCLDYFNAVSESYDRNHVLILDGEDTQEINNNFLSYGIYFKRELCTNWYNVLPISFSFPKQKFFLGETNKMKGEAFITPLDKNTYIYENEEDYYEDYRSSFFGYTMGKGGWDCLRHYEIVANKCIPYFNKYEGKPVYTMTNWPSDLQAEANYLFYHGDSQYYERIEKLTKEFFDYAYENLTCEEVAKRMINKL